MKERLAAIFERLQTLDIQPTEENMKKLLLTLNDLREIYEELGKGETDEADPEGRNGD